jgi:hypothetical protein
MGGNSLARKKKEKKTKVKLEKMHKEGTIKEYPIPPHKDETKYDLNKDVASPSPLNWSDVAKELSSKAEEWNDEKEEKEAYQDKLKKIQPVKKIKIEEIKKKEEKKEEKEEKEEEEEEEEEKTDHLENLGRKNSSREESLSFGQKTIVSLPLIVCLVAVWTIL